MESLRKKIDLTSHHTSQPSIIWCKLAPIKVVAFIWRASLGRIPTSSALMSRGINIPSSLCGSCVGADEQVDHLLVNCPFATYVREMIFIWCGICPPTITGVGELIQFVVTWGNCMKQRRRFIVICYGLLWGIWKFRNDRIFNGTFTTPSRGVEISKSMSFLWIKVRGSGNFCNWDEWRLSPFYVL